MIGLGIMGSGREPDESIAAGAGRSRMLEVRGPMIEIIAAFARSAGAATPLFSATAPLYTAAVRMGRGGEDTAAVHAVIERMKPSR